MEAHIKTSLLSTALLVPVLWLSTSFAQDRKTIEEYWSEAGVHIDHINYENMDCFYGSQNFRSCIAGIDSLGEHLTPKVKLIPKEALNDSDVAQGAIVKELREFVLVEKPTKPKDQSLHSFIKQRNIEYQKLKQLNESLHKKIMLSSNFDEELNKEHVDFEAIKNELVAQIKANPVKQNILSIIAAQFENDMLSVMDAHTYDLPTAYADSMGDMVNASYYGVGLVVQLVDKSLVIKDLKKDSPADLSKRIKKNDILIRVDDFSTEQVEDYEFDDVTNKLTGENDSSVTLTLRRGEQIYEVTLKRKKLQVSNVVSKVLTDFDDNRIGYIKVDTFVDNRACEEVAKQIHVLHLEKISGLILDLRNNGGGYLEQARCIAGLFVGNKAVVGVKNILFRKQEIRYLRAMPLLQNGLVSNEEKPPYPAKQYTQLPMVTLINEGSASASEIVAGALQHLKRSWILGETSFGKGSVQKLRYKPTNHKIMRARTEEKFYQPSGLTNQAVGIQADITVPFKPDATEDERFSPRELDLFPEAFSAEGQSWQQPRAEQVKSLENCIEKKELSKKKYFQLKADDPEVDVDYQLLVAQEVFGCPQ